MLLCQLQYVFRIRSGVLFDFHSQSKNLHAYKYLILDNIVDVQLMHLANQIIEGTQNISILLACIQPKLLLPAPAQYELPYYDE